MAEADFDFDDFDDDDLNPEEREEARTAINIVPEEDRFQFKPMKCPIMDEIKDKYPDSYELFEEWGWLPQWKMFDYAYDKTFHPHQKLHFVLSFFLNRAVKPTLRTNRDPRSFDMMSLAHTIDGMDAQELSCDVLNMEFFDRLWDKSLVTPEGELMKATHDSWGDIELEDEIRKMLILKYSEFFTLYSEEERKELIFMIFKYLVMTGDYMKHGNEIGPYLHTTRLLYKMLVTTIRDQNHGAVSVESLAYKVQAKMGEFKIFPPSFNIHQSFCFFIIDNRKKRLRVWFNYRP